MNYQRPVLLLSPCIRTAPQFPHFNSTVRIEHLQRWRRGGRRLGKRRWNDLEGLFSKGGHVVLPQFPIGT